MARNYTENLCLSKSSGIARQLLVPVGNNTYPVCVNQMIFVDIKSVARAER